jgi:hypothetical protein
MQASIWCAAELHQTCVLRPPPDPDPTVDAMPNCKNVTLSPSSLDVTGCRCFRSVYGLILPFYRGHAIGYCNWDNVVQKEHIDVCAVSTKVNPAIKISHYLNPFSHDPDPRSMQSNNSSIPRIAQALPLLRLTHWQFVIKIRGLRSSSFAAWSVGSMNAFQRELDLQCSCCGRKLYRLGLNSSIKQFSGDGPIPRNRRMSGSQVTRLLQRERPILFFCLHGKYLDGILKSPALAVGVVQMFHQHTQATVNAVYSRTSTSVGSWILVAVQV